MKRLLLNKIEKGVEFSLPIFTALNSSTTILLIMVVILLIGLVFLTLHLNKNLKEGNRVNFTIWFLKYEFENKKPPSELVKDEGKE